MLVVNFQFSRAKKNATFSFTTHEFLRKNSNETFGGMIKKVICQTVLRSIQSAFMKMMWQVWKQLCCQMYHKCECKDEISTYFLFWHWDAVFFVVSLFLPALGSSLSLWFAAFLKIEPSKYYCFGKSKPRGEESKERDGARARPSVLAACAKTQRSGVWQYTKRLPEQQPPELSRSEAEMTMSAEASEATST